MARRRSRVVSGERSECLAMQEVAVAIAAVAARPGPSAKLIISVLILASLLEIIALVLVLRGSIILARSVIPIMLIIAITIIAYGTHSIHDISITGFPLIIIIAIII